MQKEYGDNSQDEGVGSPPMSIGTGVKVRRVSDEFQGRHAMRRGPAKTPRESHERARNRLLLPLSEQTPTASQGDEHQFLPEAVLRHRS